MEAFNCGHPRTAENTRNCGRYQICRECDRATSRERYRKYGNRKDANCSTCNKAIEKANKTGRCITCITGDAAEQAKRQEALRRRFRHDPELSKRAGDRIRAVASTPEHAERSRARMIDNRVWEKAGPVVAGSPRALKIGASVSATRMAWCPPHLRGAYRELMKLGDMRTDEARALILDQNEIEMRRWRSQQGIVVVGNELPALDSSTAHFAPARRVLERAAQVFSVSVDDIKGTCRQRMFIRPRCAIAHVLHGHGWSSPRIATFLGKGDHTTCLNWLKRAEQMMADEAFDSAIDELEDAWAFQLPEALAA